MPRKKRNLIMILTILAIIIVITLIIGIIYLQTDLLKSKSTLFKKYFSQNFEVLQSELSFEEEQKFSAELNDYTDVITGTIGYSSDGENALTLDIREKGNIKKSQNSSYRTYLVSCGNKNLLEFETINKDSIYGLRLTGLIKQFLSVDTQSEESLDGEFNLSSLVNFLSNKDSLNFSEAEKEELINTFSNIICKDFTSENFSKQSDAIITVDGQSITTNAYILTISKEQTEIILKNLIEELKNNPIILQRITNMSEDFSFEYQNKLDNILNNMDFDMESLKITTYAQNGKTVRTSIKIDDVEAVLDIKKHEDTIVVTVTYKEIYQDEVQSITLDLMKQQTNSGYKLDIIISDGINKTQLERKFDTLENGAQTTNKISIITEDLSELTIDLKEEISKTSGEDIIELNDENNVVLNDSEEEDVEEITLTFIQKLVGNLAQNLSSIDNETLNLAGDYLQFSGLIDESSQEMQTNTFNSYFEFYEGEELSGEEVRELLENVRGNLASYDVITGRELKLNIEKDTTSEDEIDTILQVIKDSRKYDIELEYNDETGIISAIYIIIK